MLLPAALLSALVVVQTFADGKELVLDARAAGLAAAMVALALRASMLVVLLVAAATRRGCGRSAWDEPRGPLTTAIRSDLGWRGLAAQRRRSASGSASELLPERDPLVLVADARLEREERPARAAAVVERADLLVAREALAVERQLGGGHRRGVGAEEQLQQRRVAQLGGVAGRLRAPRVERRRPASVMREHAPAPPARSRRSSASPAFASRSGSA